MKIRGKELEQSGEQNILPWINEFEIQVYF